jgi:type II secretory pathway component PulC
VRRAVLLVSCFLLACGGDELPPPKTPAKKPAPAVQNEPPPGTLWRDQVDATVDAGLGRFLRNLFAQLTVEPYLDEQQQFVGWEVVRVHDPQAWSDIDLQPGDVVTAVNSLPLERETQAYDAFVSLKQAGEIDISLVRGGERLELVFKIAHRPGSPKPAPAQSKPSPEPKPSGQWPDSGKPKAPGAKPAPAPAASAKQ